MTKEDVIEILERFVIGAKPCSQREIVDACASAYRMLKEQAPLPEEKPSEDLEKEIDSYWNRKTGFQPPFAVVELRKKNIANIARHFAQWGAEQQKKMKSIRVVPEDAWETSEGMAFAPKFKVVDGDGYEGIPVPGINEELTLYYKED